MGKIMFFDVDGTLFRREFKVPASADKAIRDAVANGNYAFLCTGRGASTMPDEVRDLPLYGEVCQCGTYVKVGDEVIVNEMVTGPECQEIFGILKKYECPFFIENPDYFFYDPEYLPEGFGDIIQGMEKNYPRCSKTIDQLGNRIAKMTGYPKVRENIPAIREALAPWFKVIDHAEYEYIEIILKDFTKGTGIEAVMEKMGIPREDTYGFGDSINDIPMLETVGTAVVMGDSPDMLKERYMVTDGITDNGIANALDKLGLTSPKVLVGSIQKFSVEDGPGIRSTVFMKGCPLNCKWCHNPELIETKQELIKSPNNCIGCGYCTTVCPNDAIKLSAQEGIVIDREKCDCCLKCADDCYAQALRPVAVEMTVNEILDSVEQDKGFYDQTGGGITLSGGEVLLHSEAARAIIDGAAARGMNVCLDTCGLGDGNVLMELAKRDNVTDILYDMKSIDDEVHKEYTGVSNKQIIENLECLASDAKTRSKINMRMPLINGINDKAAIIEATGRLYERLKIEKLTLLPYHELGISKQRNIGGNQDKFIPPTKQRITEIEEFFTALGIKVEVLGQI